MTLTRFSFTNRVRPVLEVGIGSSVFDAGSALWDVSLWDVGTWNGDEPLWTDVSCDVVEVLTESGRGRVMDAFPVGTATVTVYNQTGWADPSTDAETDPVLFDEDPPSSGLYAELGESSEFVQDPVGSGLYARVGA